MGCASSKMRSESVSIPEEYMDILVQEFAYDPIRQPLTEDPAQVLYNRRTLQTIWDTQHEALNPFTRQPFNMSDVIPQADLRQQMGQYIVSNRSQLQVISDYTKVLSETDMKNLLNELISDYKNLINGKKWKKRKLQQEQYWKALWQRFNLLRLYCQYRAENRELFSSIRGYDFLYQVVTKPLFCVFHQYNSSSYDAMEVGKEVARLVDLIGFNESELATVPEKFLWALVHIMSDLAAGCDHVKVRSMVLRIYCRLFYDGGIDCKKVFCCFTVRIALYMLGERENVTDISNEDLYNAISIVKVAWVKNKNLCISEINYVDVIVKVVNLCISRLKDDLHAASIACREKPNDPHDDDEEEMNMYMISIALSRGLWLIHSIVTVTAYDGEAQFFWDSKQKLYELEVVDVIVRLVELAHAGYKYLRSSHLQLGLIIVGALRQQGDVEEEIRS